MDIIYFQLWLCYFALLLMSLRLTRGQFSPTIAFFVTWNITLGLLSLGSIHSEFRPPPLARSASFYLLLAGSSLFAGSFFAHALGPLTRKRTAHASTDVQIQRRDSFNLPFLKLLSIGAMLFTFLYIVKDAPDLRTYISSGHSIREQLTDPSNSSASGIAAVATYAALIVLPVSAIYWFRHRKVKWWMIIPLLSVVLLSLLSIGKFLIIFLGLTFLNAALYHQATIPTLRVRRGPIFAIVATILCAFSLITALRSQTDNVLEPAPRAGFAFTIYDYATGYVPAFGRYYEEHLNGDVSTLPTNADYNADNGRFGNQTFSGFYRLFAQLSLVKQSATNRYEGTFNVYSIHRDLIMDFGISGALLSMFLIGLFSTLLYRHCKSNEPRKAILLALITTQLEFTLIYSLFGFIFYPMLLFISPLLANTISSPRDILADQTKQDYLPTTI